MAEENDHSLRMQIEADFGISAIGADNFEQKMAEINRIVGELSNKISTVRDGGKTLQKGVEGAVSEIYKDIKDGTFQLDGTSIKTAIEKRIADAIGKRGIAITNLEEGSDALKVAIDKNAADNLRKSLAAELGKLAENITISGVKRGKLDIPINNDAIQSIQTKFNEKMQESLEKNIQFTNMDGEKLGLKVTESNMASLLSTVKDRFFKILNSPSFVQVDETKLKPIVISSEALESALQNVKNAIGNIDEKFTGTTFKQLSDLPNVKTKIEAFQRHTAALFTELAQTIDAIDQLNPQEKNYDGLKNEAAKMKERIVNAGTRLIKEVTAVYDSELRKPDKENNNIAAQVVNDLGAIRAHINAYVSNLADEAYKSMVKELNMARDASKGNMYGPSLQKLQEAVVEASKQALKNLDTGNLKIDTEAVKGVFDNWSMNTSQQLMANAFKTLTDLQTDLLAQNKKVMNAYVKSLKKLASIEFSPIQDGDNKIEVSIDAKKVQKDIQEKMRAIAEQMVSNVNLTKGAQNSLDTGLTLTKKQTDTIQASVATILEGQLTQLSGQLQNRLGKDFDSSLLEKFDKQLFGEAKRLVTTMVDQANAISRAITDGMDSTGFKALSTDEQDKIQARFRAAGNKMVTDFSAMMDNALNSLVLTSSMTEEVKSKIQDKFSALAKNADISFNDANTPLMLSGLVAEAQRELQTALKINIEAWKPDLAAFDPSINFKQVFDNISNAINAQLRKASDDITKMVNQQAAPLNPQQARKFMDADVRGKDDMSVYSQKKLAGNDLKRLQEQGFEYLEKGAKGHEYKLKDSSKLSDEFDFLMVELDKKFAEQARKQSEKIRQQNLDVSKQKIVTVLEPIRTGVLTYLSLYVKAVGDAITGIQPNVSADKVNTQLGKKIQDTVNTVMGATTKAVEATIDDLSKHTAAAVKSIQSQTQEKPNLNIDQVIKSTDLHGEVRKLFAKQYGMLVKNWEKANPTFEGAEGVAKVLEGNVQVIMNKFHETVTTQTRKAISHYLDELKQVDTKPRTEGVNYLTKALEDIQGAFNEKMREFVQSQVNVMAQAIKGLNFKGVSVGANVQQLVDNAYAQQAAGTASPVRPPVQYRNDLPFPDLDGDGKPMHEPRSAGFYQQPGQSQWLSNIHEQFDDDWGRINGWVNQRLLDGLNAKTAVHGKVPGDLENHLIDYIDNHFTPSVKSVASMRYDPEDADATKAVRDEMERIIQDFKLATSWVKKLNGQEKALTDNESYAIQQDGLRQQVGVMRNKGIVSPYELDFLDMLIGDSKTPNDLKAVRVEMAQIRELQRQITEAERTGNAKEAFNLQQDSLRQQLDVLRNKGVLPESNINDVDGLIDASKTLNDLKYVRNEMARIRELQRQLLEDQRTVKSDESLAIQKDGMLQQASVLRNKGILPTSELDELEGLIGRVSKVSELKRARIEMSNMRELQRQMIEADRKENAGESFDLQRVGLRQQLDVLRNKAVLPESNINDVEGLIDASKTLNDLKYVRNEMARIRELQRQLLEDQRTVKSEESLAIQKEGMLQQAGVLRNKGILPASELDELENLIDRVSKVSELKRARIEMSNMRELQRQMIEADRKENADESFSLQRVGLRQQLGVLRNKGVLPEDTIQEVDSLIDTSKTQNDLKNVRNEMARIRELQRQLLEDQRTVKSDESLAIQKDSMLQQAAVLRNKNILPASELDELEGLIGRVSKVSELQRARIEMSNMRELQRLMIEDSKKAVTDESFGIQKDGLLQQTSALRNRGILPLGEIESLEDSIKAAQTANDLKRVRVEMAHIKELQKQLSDDKRLVSSQESLGIQKDSMLQQLDVLRNKAILPTSEINRMEDAINLVDNVNDLKRARIEMANIRELQRQIIEDQRAADAGQSLGTQKRAMSQQVEVLRNRGVLPNDNLDDMERTIGGVASSDALKNARIEMARLKELQRQMIDQQRELTKDEAFGISKDNIQQQISTFRNKGIVPSDELDNLSSLLGTAETENDLKRVRVEMARIRELQRQILEDEKDIKSSEDLALKKDAVRQQIGFMRNKGVVPADTLDTIEGLLDEVLSPNDLKRVRMGMSAVKELQRQIKEDEKATQTEDGFLLSQRGLQQQADVLRNKGHIPANELESLENHIWGAVDTNGLKNARIEMARLRELQRQIIDDNKNITSQESLGISKDSLRQQVDVLRNKGIVPEDRLINLSEMINGADTANDLKRVRVEMSAVRELQRTMLEAKKKAAKEDEQDRKQGNLLVQNDALKTNLALQVESLQVILKTVPALQRYNVEQMRVNNATNSWSARLKDAEGNVRSLQGTVDRTTGSLYQHSEALSTAASQAARLASTKGSNYGKGYAFNRNYYPTNTGAQQTQQHNPNGDFTSSVWNTMRYMTAGSLMGYPSMMMYQAWESNKQFEYQMERARQNFVIKGDIDPATRMQDVAIDRVAAANPGVDLESGEAKALIEAERQSLLQLAGDQGNMSKEIIQNMAIKYRIDMDKAAQAFHISSRLLSDPNDAYAMTEAVVKANSIEEMDIVTGTKGMEAVSAQWGLKGSDYDEVINMMIMAANYTPATVEDLLATQQRSGSIFRNALPDMGKKEALSTSIALSAMFNQSTARSGAEGGTFFKTILQSPFTKKGAKALQSYSIQEGFQDLDPYNEDGSQKNFVEVFSSIMEHSLKMTPEQKRNLWASIFPQWHQGSAGAIEVFMNDMMKELQVNMERVKSKSGDTADTDGDGEISVNEAFQDYFKKVSSGDTEAIDEMRKGNASTWLQQIQYLTTVFQSSMSGIFDSLKDDFSQLSVYLVAYMRAISENTAAVTAAMAIASKVALGVAGRYVFNKVGGAVKDSYRKRKEERFENVGDALIEERRSHNLNQIVTDDLIRKNEGKHSDIQERKSSVTRRMQENDVKKAGLTNRRDDARNRRQTLIEGLQNGESNVDAIREVNKEINKLNGVISKLEERNVSLTGKLNDLDEKEKEVTRETERLTKEFNEQGQQLRSVNARMDALADSMDDVGLDGQKMRSQVEQLSQELRQGSTTVSQYESELNDLARESGLSERSLNKLKEQVDKVNQEFKEGKISAQQYASAIKDLERAHKFETSGVPGGGVGSAGTLGQSGMGLMEAVIAGSLLTGGMSKLGRGVIDRFKDFKQTKDVRNLFGRGAAMRDSNGNILYEQNPDGSTSNRPIRQGDVLQSQRNLNQQNPSNGNKWYQKGIFGSIGGVYNKAKNMKGLGTLLRVGKGVGIPWLVGETIMKGSDLLSSTMMQDYENMNVQADNLDDLSATVENIKYGGLGQKALGALTLFGDATIGSINKLLGGNEPGLGNIWGALTTDSTSREDLRAKLTDKFDTGSMRKEAEEMKTAHEEKTQPQPEVGEGTLETPEEKAAREVEEAAMELTAALGELNATMNRQLSMNDAQFTIDKTHMLLSGMREDSAEMRDLMEELLEKNGVVLAETLADLRDKMGNVADKESTTYKDMELQEKQLEAQIVENDYKLRQNDLSEYDEIMNTLSEQLSASEDEYGIQESQAKLAGADDDSPILKKIQSAKVGDANTKIEQAQTDLANLVNKLNLKESDPDYIKIQDAIRDLEKQQLDNLVAIKSNLDKSKGTFNLPSGIKVTDYMSHVMSKNSHSNITTRTGDTVVNVTIDNMSGTAKDVQTVTDALTDAVKKANQQGNSNFNKQVWSGMGSSYTSPY